MVVDKEGDRRETEPTEKLSPPTIEEISAEASPLPLLSHVLDHPVSGQRANGTHYGPSVSCHYSNPHWVLRELRDRESLDL